MGVDASVKDKRGQKMQKTTNGYETTCHDCEKALGVGEGTKPSSWYDYFICAECEAKREEAERQQRVKQAGQAVVAAALVPQIAKVGAIKRIMASPENYTSTITIVVQDRQYVIEVREQDND